MIEIFLALVLGILAGIVTGLVPGVHVNLVAAILLSLSAVLLRIVDANVLAVFIISMAVVHTFLDAIPSIYLGAPEAESVLAVLPGHRMLLQGRGYEAVKLMTIGSYFALVLVVVLSPLLVFVMIKLQDVLANWIGWLLILIVVWMVLREKSKLFAAFVFLLSGVLGLVVLNLDLEQPLFPMLSGLFGLSTLLMSLNEKVNIPKQQIMEKTYVKKRQLFTTVGISSIVGSLVGFFPGVGPAQAAVVGSQFLRGGNKNFLVLVGGIGTANMIASLITFFALDKARNGAIVVVRELLEKIFIWQFSLFLVAALVAGSAAMLLTLFFAKHFAKWLEKVKYKWLCFSVIGFVVLLVGLLSGWVGLIVLVVATLTGMIAPLFNVSRSHAMGCLLLPVILWFML